jgi:hypothetical protein
MADDIGIIAIGIIIGADQALPERLQAQSSAARSSLRSATIAMRGIGAPRDTGLSVGETERSSLTTGQGVCVPI